MLTLATFLANFFQYMLMLIQMLFEARARGVFRDMNTWYEYSMISVIVVKNIQQQLLFCNRVLTKSVHCRPSHQPDVHTCTYTHTVWTQTVETQQNAIYCELRYFSMTQMYSVMTCDINNA